MNAFVPIPPRVVKVTAKGWFVFCPVWLVDGWQDGDTFELVPRFRLWLLYDACIWIQQAVNFVIGLFDEDKVGFYVSRVREIEPREVVIE